MRVFVVLLLSKFIYIAARSYCFSGSSLYQLENVDCTEKDSSYNDIWYCSTVRVCESYISSARECIETRGCAKKEECINPTTDTEYADEKVYFNGDKEYGGMEISVSCCVAGDDFPDDDAVAINMADICNSSNMLQFDFKLVLQMFGVMIIGYFVL